MITKEDALKHLQELKNQQSKNDLESPIHRLKYGSNNGIYSYQIKQTVRFPLIKEILEKGERIECTKYDGTDFTDQLIAKINKRYNTEFRR